MTGQRQPAYGHQDEYADEYGEDEYGHDSDYEYETEHEPADQDDDPGSKRRSSTKVVIAVLALAVFGSAAAFGYRTMFRDAPSGPTPIIRADNSPTKVIPGGDASAKPVNERVGDNTGERLVRRDEDPVDVGATYRSGSGDSGAAGPLPDAGYPPPATVPAGGPGSSSDTRRVRTVTIRPDQSAAASDRAPPPPSRATPPPAAPPAAPQAPPPRQTAALSAPTTSGPPVAVAPEAAVPRAADAGGFVVQLSAQRSEADAQAAFRTMQGKYSTVLSGHQPLIRRKDLGERGIFYAAQVGPFGAKSDADQLCETLKSAGGTCFVQKN
ncbi:MAG TPA: SPOR domain-containing protein [Xanthobacteraceae bacterium]|nr:SPOR domain-containing protein [Xanthobacteraceae bacterium]